MLHTRHLLVGVAAIALCAACGDSTEPATPGTLSASLVTPHANDGGILLTVQGAIVDVSTTNVTHRVYWRLASGETRVLLFGNLVSGPLLTLNVPDVGALSSYSAAVVEVTDRNNQLRDSFAGYSITFTRTTASP
jgi:hypothetical protein